MTQNDSSGDEPTGTTDVTIPGVETLGETNLDTDWNAYRSAGSASGETLRRLGWRWL